MRVITNPEHLRELDDSVYNNFDHVMDRDVVEQLKAGDCRAQHAAWNFCAWVWFEDGRYKSYVMRHHYHVGTYDNENIDDLVRHVNERFGDE